MKKAWQIFLMVVLAWVVFVGSIAGPAIYVNTVTAASADASVEQAVEQAFETCRYGAQQFYFARAIPVEQSLELALRDCYTTYEFYDTDREFIAAFTPHLSYEEITR